MQGRPNYALDCSTCILNMLSQSTWHLSDWGREFYGKGGVKKFFEGGGGWFKEPLI
jgi:hypothetical protein